MSKSPKPPAKPWTRQPIGRPAADDVMQAFRDAIALIEKPTEQLVGLARSPEGLHALATVPNARGLADVLRPEIAKLNAVALLIESVGGQLEMLDARADDQIPF